MHNLNNLDKNVLAKELELIAQEKPMELILPCLFSELQSDALRNILEKINKINFLQHIIIGLDRANKEEFDFAKNYFSNLKTSHSILWNDGPRLKKLQNDLNKEELANV